MHFGPHLARRQPIEGPNGAQKTRMTKANGLEQEKVRIKAQ